MGKDYGEPIKYDPDFNGPIHNRSCTDIFWLILFIVFLGGWGWVGYYSMKNGDLDKLLAPMDSNGSRCGLDSGVKNKKYLVFFDIAKCLSPETPITGCPTPQVCVEQCPTRTILIEAQLTKANFEEFKPHMVCTNDINVQTMQYEEAAKYIKDDKCASYVIQSQPVMGRCFINVTEAVKYVKEFTETGADQLLSQVSDLVKFEQVDADLYAPHAPKSPQSSFVWAQRRVGDVISIGLREFRQCGDFGACGAYRSASTLRLSAQIVQDLVQSRWYLLGALGAVVVVCFIYILLLRWVVGPVVWASIAGLLALLGFSIYLCYKQYIYYRDHPVTMIPTTNLKNYAESLLNKHQTWLAILIAVAVIFVILLLLVIFLRSRITIAIALIREGSKAVYAVKSTMFFPIFSWVFQCAIIAYGVLVMMFLLSIGESTFSVVNLENDTSCNCHGYYTKDYVPCTPLTFIEKCQDVNTDGLCKQASCHFTGLDNPHAVVWLILVNLLGFFWAMFFVSGVSDMMLASTFSTWYWTFHKSNLPFFTLTSGVYRTLRYHLGTVAFGSLIIAIVRVIRVILEYIDHKLKKFDNPLTRCVMCLCKCFCWCLENFLKFINKNAYIMCAVHGGSFCKSARDAFSLLMRNIIRVIVLDKVTDFIFFLSKLLISIGVGFAVYYLLQWSFVYEVTKGEPLHYNYIPAIILSIATYLICSIFFNVYAMAVDTLFLCFLEDCERNDGSAEKPYFMSKNLMKILGKKNKQS